MGKKDIWSIRGAGYSEWSEYSECSECSEWSDNWGCLWAGGFRKMFVSTWIYLSLALR